MKRQLALVEGPDNKLDPIEQAAQVLSEPLPVTEPELSREIARRSEVVEQILHRHALEAVQG
jgi:hypothetical protein